MSDHKFKVGDKVIRVQDNGALAVGTVCTVERVSNAGGFIDVGTGTGWHDVHNFEHYAEKPAVDHTAVLAPLKVFEHILAGTPLEYSPKANEQPEWFSLTNPKYVNLGTIEQCDFRVEPQTVQVNGISVPAPMTHLEIAECADRRTGYYIELARGHIYTKRILSGQRVWRTKEEAQEVLDAIMTSFSK